MKLFMFYISFIFWGNDGKRRPVLVFDIHEDTAYVYPVTSKYESKSEAIKTRYFKINDWKIAGLDKESYVDTGHYIPINVSALKDKTPIGEISINDKRRLIEFIVSSCGEIYERD